MTIDEKAFQAAVRAVEGCAVEDPFGYKANFSAALKAAILAYESAKQKEADGWRTMDSAPKDGTIVLLWGPYCSNPCTCEFRHGDWAVMADGQRAVEYMSDFSTDYFTFEVPTHWRPLPEPPSALLSAGGEG